MKQRGIGWRGWAGASAAALIVILLVGAMFRLPAPPTPPPKRATTVDLVRLRDNADGLLKEDATLRDPTPLFLPTSWNAGENALPPGARRSPGLSFKGYGPKLSFSRSSLQLQLPPPVELPRQPADAFTTERAIGPLQALGQTDEPAPSVPPRAGFVSVVAAASGRIMLAQPLADAQPPGGAQWQPLEFLVAIDRTGLVRPAVLTASSRIPAVDGYFQEYLANQLHLGARLPPGFYRVGFGP